MRATGECGRFAVEAGEPRRAFRQPAARENTVEGPRGLRWGANQEGEGEGEGAGAGANRPDGPDRPDSADRPDSPDSPDKPDSADMPGPHTARFDSHQTPTPGTLPSARLYSANATIASRTRSRS